MKYYVSFKNGNIDCSWQREDNDENQKPNYIDVAYEVTEDQYTNKKYLSLVNNEIVFDVASYRAYKMSKIRVERDAKIAESEWLLLRHEQEKELLQLGTIQTSSLTEQQRNTVLIYLQNLRDLPNTIEAENYVNIDNVEFPTLSL